MADDVLVSLVDGIGQKYGKRPSEIIGIKDSEVAFDFDAAVMIQAAKIQRGEFSSTKLKKLKQTKGFYSVKALQDKVRQSYRRGNG